MTNQIFVVIADGSQREWTDAEKHLVSQSPELIEQLLVWLENSLSDSCWHPENYEFLQKLTKPKPEPKSFFDEKIEIPF
ncbi:hypothetical protein H6H01_36165 [Nostoc calcicola FACHB-3891]|nr:hypothetical protein [Nostoc calcicola FACHB-3891]